ncbi:MAG: RluA family pseudouridine synthase [Burkholderiaceae bacterium]|nr:RluA family pseudouridine synthase [Burkholderiaceae bacterium]MCD8565917.1 RluA family pseudouridine synthase [Burkholderiaceae bacterium]
MLLQMVQPESLTSETEDADELISVFGTDVLHFLVQQPMAGDRLDKVLAKLIPEHSRARIQGWIEAGHVQVNGQANNRVRQIVAAGDEISVKVQSSEQALALEPDDVAFEVVRESPEWLVVNKQAGLVVHPGAGNWQGTLLNGLLFRYPSLSHVARAGIVHRLDKDTTGLMVVAKSETAQTHLVRQLQQRTVKRHYRALVHGWLKDAQMTVDRAIGRDPKVPVRMSVSGPGPGKPAITHVSRLRTGTLAGQPVTEIKCQLETGRTHQIRVHLASVKHPLVGDTLYGGKVLVGAVRQMLHAESLSFVDPVSEQWVSLTSELPGDMQSVLNQVQWTDAGAC